MTAQDKEGTRFFTLRDVLSLENEALGIADVDWDRARERAFCSPNNVQELEESCARTS